MARVRAGKLIHIWAATQLTETLKMRLYISSCCSILTYGSEAWLLDTKVRSTIRCANACMLSHITGRTIQEEANTTTTTFEIIVWIRAHRLQWLGHILCMQADRLVHQAAHHIYENKRAGDMMMDAPAADS